MNIYRMGIKGEIRKFDSVCLYVNDIKTKTIKQNTLVDKLNCKPYITDFNEIKSTGCGQIRFGCLNQKLPISEYEIIVSGPDLFIYHINNKHTTQLEDFLSNDSWKF